MPNIFIVSKTVKETSIAIVLRLAKGADTAMTPYGSLKQILILLKLIIFWTKALPPFARITIICTAEKFIS